MRFVIARTASGRPTLQHRLDADGVRTLCGLDVTHWSRAYQSERINAIACRNCNKGWF